jgi:hypothetical protein
MQTLNIYIKGAISVIVALLMTFISTSSASAAPDPNNQGGNSGVIYFTERTDGTFMLATSHLQQKLFFGKTAAAKLIK